MLFNTTVFLGFFALVYGLYLGLGRHHRAQNLLLWVSSYVFYGWWDWRFLGLIALSTAVDFAVGMGMERSADPRRRVRLLRLSIGTNLGILGAFKYFDFFAASLADLGAGLGVALDPVTLDLVLPVGVSFYTFQSMSYSIDVYRGRIPATRDPLDFALFVSFFPQLVAGPIERARRLLPQIARPRRITASGVQDGLFLLAWGFFKKVVVGDNAGRVADHIFANYQVYDSLDLTLGVLAFSVQIYADFSGYSDIARGLARLLGFDLSLNFRLPFFARSPQDFWRRWHVSLSEWLRDYVYIPLGGSRAGRWHTLRNLTLTLLLGGLWHGAAFNFVVWGAYHAGLLIAYRLLPGLERGGLPLMLLLSLAGWMIFRVESMDQLLHFVAHVGLTPSPVSGRFGYDLAFFGLLLLGIELWQHRRGDLLAPARAPLPAQMLLHATLLAGIVVFGSRQPVEFLYFQF